MSNNTTFNSAREYSLYDFSGELPDSNVMQQSLWSRLQIQFEIFSACLHLLITMSYNLEPIVLSRPTLISLCIQGTLGLRLKLCRSSHPQNWCSHRLVVCMSALDSSCIPSQLKLRPLQNQLSEHDRRIPRSRVASSCQPNSGPGISSYPSDRILSAASRS